MISDLAPPPTSSAPPPRLLEQVWQRGNAATPEPTVAAFANWNRRFILFHGKRHPGEMGLPEVWANCQFLQFIAQTEKDPVRALAASRDALDFLYREVLHLARGAASVASPLDMLTDTTPEQAQAALDATRFLAAQA